MDSMGKTKPPPKPARVRNDQQLPLLTRSYHYRKVTTMTTQTAVQPEVPEMASEVFTMEVVHVNRTLAQRWLKLNTKNRNLRPRQAAKLHKDIVDGNWAFDGMPIRFSVGGKLIDGQHRLTAIANVVDDDISVPLVVMRGIKDAAQYVMDQGSKRTAADQLGLDGIKHASLIAAGVRVYLVHRAGLLYSDHKKWDLVTTFPQIRQFVHQNPWVIDVAENTYRSLKGKAYPFTPSVSFAVAMLGWQVDPDTTAHYFRALKEGGVALNNPANRLKNWGVANADKSVSLRDEFALLLEHWNKVMQQKPMRREPNLWTSQPGPTVPGRSNKDRPTRFDDPLNFPKTHGLKVQA